MSKGNARNDLRSFVEKSGSLAVPYPNSKNWLQSQGLDEKNMLFKLSIIYLCVVLCACWGSILSIEYMRD